MIAFLVATALAADPAMAEPEEEPDVPAREAWSVPVHYGSSPTYVDGGIDLFPEPPPGRLPTGNPGDRRKQRLRTGLTIGGLVVGVPLGYVVALYGAVGLAYAGDAFE